MTGIPAELVERAARAIQRVTSFGHYEATDAALAALEAIGLPALLERVEAAEGEVERLHEDVHANNQRGDNLNANIAEQQQTIYALHAERDALAAKVADAGERITQAIEAMVERDYNTQHCSSPGGVTIVARGAQAGRQAAAIARAALTEGTEGA